jgi:hypothetical protein
MSRRSTDTALLLIVACFIAGLIARTEERRPGSARARDGLRGADGAAMIEDAWVPEEARVRRLDVPVTAMVPVIMALGAGLRDLLEAAHGTAPSIALHPAQG